MGHEEREGHVSYQIRVLGRTKYLIAKAKIQKFRQNAGAPKVFTSQTIS